jgi:hypothetical protein
LAAWAASAGVALVRDMLRFWREFDALECCAQSVVLRVLLWRCWSPQARPAPELP